MEIEEIGSFPPLPLLSLNHISLLCRSVKNSIRFYKEILGFIMIKRPSSFGFDGAWLFNYGVGIHLLKNSSIGASDFLRESRPINPKDNHISFQCTDIGVVKRKLEEMGIEHEKATAEDGGIWVEQVFFHDPDGYMIEICNCENLPILPLSSSSTSFKDVAKTIACKNTGGIACGLLGAAATLLCAADEAALCVPCDEKIHLCNKLASRHVRVGIADPSIVPRCDICENAPAFFYCEIDGTSLCLQCDITVHVGGKRTHERFLLLRQRAEFPVDKSANSDDQPRQPMNPRENRWHPPEMTVKTHEQNKASAIPISNGKVNHQKMDIKMFDLNTRPNNRINGQASSSQGMDVLSGNI
ncbi:hypothetical protein MKX01_023832 [Papaver californicum]|nr:hypothetical protein MKX01_023832 [Papaver californicum]